MVLQGRVFYLGPMDFIVLSYLDIIVLVILLFLYFFQWQ